jgi:tetratricopeptide (TPR) repeat protein
LAAEPAAVDQIIVHCARLPLALAVAAARAQTGHTLTALAEDLGRTRLDTLDTGDAGTQVRTVFSWSYRALNPDAARLFRLLGLHPGPDLSAAAAASLAALPPSAAGNALAELVRANLVVEPVSGRYTLHDLLRAYAAELVTSEETTEQRQTATHRLLDHYLHTAFHATLLLERGRETLTLPAPAPGVRPETYPDFTRAQDWFTTERAVLVAAVHHAAANGFDSHAWQLAWTLTVFLDRQHHWHDGLTTGHAAVAATERVADGAAQARAHRLLSCFYIRLREYDDALGQLQQALALYGKLDDKGGQGNTHRNLAQMWGRQGRYPEALEHARQALAQYRAAGFPREEATAFNTVGWYHALLGDYQEALSYCRQSVVRQQVHQYRPGLADAWDSLGYIHRALGDHTEAIACYQRATDLYRDIGDRYEQAETLTQLADAFDGAGHPDRARDCRERALAILTELDHPDANAVRAKLSQP